MLKEKVSHCTFAWLLIRQHSYAKLLILYPSANTTRKVIDYHKVWLAETSIFCVLLANLRAGLINTYEHFLYLNLQAGRSHQKNCFPLKVILILAKLAINSCNQCALILWSLGTYHFPSYAWPVCPSLAICTWIQKRQFRACLWMPPDSYLIQVGS